jgi:hypothetical protein
MDRRARGACSRHVCKGEKDGKEKKTMIGLARTSCGGSEGGKGDR